MSRGAGRRRIFHGDDYFHAFLDTLEQAHDRFGVQVLCYCLMGNHYHLLVKTPRANLGRAMRHINGVYTQRHNRLRKTDGPLFRGRYKAICVEADSYQLQLSRYIHRNPVEAKCVSKLDEYPWSSYGYYVSNQKSPKWLYQNDIYDQLDAKSQQRVKYRNFVELGVDEELKKFYRKGNQVPYLGSDAFRDWAYDQRQTSEEAVSRRVATTFRPAMDEIIDEVANIFGVGREEILLGGRTRGQTNIARQAAMYLCQQRGDYRLKEIAAVFGLKSYGSVSAIVGQFKQRILEDKRLAVKINLAI
jgi:REP element-mobilizing transposase RayT